MKDRMTIKWAVQTIGSLVIIVSMLLVWRYVAPTGVSLIDKILYWTFGVFAVGIAELFVIFILMAVWGQIDLAKAFVDKSEIGADGDTDGNIGSSEDSSTGAAPASEPSGTASRRRMSRGAPTVSLSRLQVFLWTLIVLVVYFHRVVTSNTGDLPTIPAELLMVMGISSATYLTSKGMDRAKQVKSDAKGTGG